MGPSFMISNGNCKSSSSYSNVLRRKCQLSLFLFFMIGRISSFSNTYNRAILNNDYVTATTKLCANKKNDYNTKAVTIEEQPDNNSNTSVRLFTDKKKIRRPPRRARKPRSYWSDIENLRKEIYDFWIKDAKVSLSPNEPLPIPSQTLINLFQRYDLKNGIYAHGGRESVVDRLGNAVLVPGKWSEAAKTCSVVQQLLDQSDDNTMSYDIPPISPQILQNLNEKKEKSNCVEEEVEEEHFKETNKIERFHGGNRWTHKKGRKPKGYWTEEIVIKQL